MYSVAAPRPEIVSFTARAASWPTSSITRGVRLDHDRDAVLLQHREPELIVVRDDRGLREAQPVAEEVARRFDALDDQYRRDRFVATGAAAASGASFDVKIRAWLHEYRLALGCIATDGATERISGGRADEERSLEDT